MKKYIFLLLILSACGSKKSVPLTEEQTINNFLNDWHKAAATANFNNYFDAMADDAIYMGTDATEYWNKTQFEAYAKPNFDKGKGWVFTTLERNLQYSDDKKTVWFNELLDTQMKICRGAGVLVKTDNGYKIKQYVLSMTVPNSNAEAIIKIKTPIEDQLIRLINNKK
ncbi:nuclear transport factor 2 family protein [Flavobacterium sp.]